MDDIECACPTCNTALDPGLASRVKLGADRVLFNEPWFCPDCEAADCSRWIARHDRQRDPRLTIVELGLEWWHRR